MNKPKVGDVVKIVATVTPQLIEGNMIRCVTRDTGEVVYVTMADLEGFEEVEENERQ